VNRAILVSGSLYLSPPLPQAIGAGLVQRLEKAVQEEEKRSLRHASASSLVKALTTCGINSMWLQDEPSFHGWQEKFETVKSLMIGDVEYEVSGIMEIQAPLLTFQSVLWRNGIETMSADEIADCFATAGEYALNLSRLYHINRSRPTQCKYGALDFINDSRFALPVDSIAKRWVREKKPVHQFVFDESNPWQSSSRAHHANDLSILFGGIDISHNRGAEQVGHHLRESWIVFANGESPWPAGKIYAFGPHGLCIGLSDDEYSLRRRTTCFEYLREMGLAPANAVVGRLAAGRISLLN
jgi:carboxylesterase type B